MHKRTLTSALSPILFLFSFAACGGAPFTLAETSLEDAGSPAPETPSPTAVGGEDGGPSADPAKDAGASETPDADLPPAEHDAGKTNFDAGGPDAALVPETDASPAPEDSGPSVPVSFTSATATCAAYAASVGQSGGECDADTQACNASPAGQDVVCLYVGGACDGHCWGFYGSVAGQILSCGTCAVQGTW